MSIPFDAPEHPDDSDILSQTYSPSVIDRFMMQVEYLGLPTWIFYLILLSILIFISNGVTWLDGTAQVGEFNVYRSSVAVYPIASLWLMHHLNGSARRALANFRPALGVNEDVYQQLEYRLTTLPPRMTWGVLGLSVLFTISFARFSPNYAEVFSASRWLFGIDFVIYLIIFGMVTVLVFHILHQLYTVSRIHALSRNVNILRPTPLYAFSIVTAKSGMSLLLMNYFSILTDPATFTNPILFAVTVLTSLVAVMCFVLPLQGMRERIVAEKQQLRAEVNARIEVTIQEVYYRTDTKKLESIDQVNQLISSLITIRDGIEKISTWPWETQTLTAFLSVFLLPFIIRLLSITLQLLI